MFSPKDDQNLAQFFAILSPGSVVVFGAERNEFLLREVSTAEDRRQHLVPRPYARNVRDRARDGQTRCLTLHVANRRPSG